MISRINVMVLYVADQETMHHFFVNKLGFETVTDAEMWPGARWLEVRPPGSETGLVLSSAKDFARNPDALYPGTFACNDLGATAERYAAAGVAVSEIFHEPWGSFFRVTDPEGREMLINDRSV